MHVPVLETDRLRIRPFAMSDLDDVHWLLDVELGNGEAVDTAEAYARRRAWLQWTVASYEELQRLAQPPYGDRAVTLRADGRLIGACGFVPLLAPFGLLASFRPAGAPPDGRFTTEFGLYYAASPSFQHQGYATEAARALLNFAFEVLKLRRVVVTTTHSNHNSMAVMHRLRMKIETNPNPEPEWFQVVGWIER